MVALGAARLRDLYAASTAMVRATFRGTAPSLGLAFFVVSSRMSLRTVNSLHFETKKRTRWAALQARPRPRVVHQRLERMLILATRLNKCV